MGQQRHYHVLKQRLLSVLSAFNPSPLNSELQNTTFYDRVIQFVPSSQKSLSRNFTILQNWTRLAQIGIHSAFWMYLETLNPGGIVPKPRQILTLWFPVTPGRIIKSRPFQLQKAFADLINVEHPISWTFSYFSFTGGGPHKKIDVFTQHLPHHKSSYQC